MGKTRSVGDVLLPCPFCGGKADVHWYDGFPSVACKCGANTGMFMNGKPDYAIAAWNTRTAACLSRQKETMGGRG